MEGITESMRLDDLSEQLAACLQPVRRPLRRRFEALRRPVIARGGIQLERE